MFGFQYNNVDALNIATTEQEQPKTFYEVNNGSAGNGNAILNLLGTAGVTVSTGTANSGSKWSMRNRMRGNMGNNFAPANIISIAVTAVVVVAAAAFIIWAVKKVI